MRKNISYIIYKDKREGWGDKCTFLSRFVNSSSHIFFKCRTLIHYIHIIKKVIFFYLRHKKYNNKNINKKRDFGILAIIFLHIAHPFIKIF